MRIIHAYRSYFPMVGGEERCLQYLAEQQVKLGHEVHVITTKFGCKESPFTENINGVNLHRIGYYDLRYPDLMIPRGLSIDLIKKADIVHTHGHNGPFSTNTLALARKLKRKTCCYFMAVDAFKSHPNFFIRTFGPYYGKRQTNSAIKNSDVLLTKSLRDAETLQKKYNTTTTYLPDGVQDSLFFTKKGSADEFRSRFNIKQPFFFLYVGRLHWLKGPHVLVEALKYLKSDVAVVFIGPDGGYLRETWNLAEKLGVSHRTYMVGYVDETTKIQAIDSAVALVNPSIADHVEVYSVVISEAWAREKSVIVSNVGELAYRVKQDVNGILVEPSNPKMLADAMLALVNNDKLAKGMGRRGRADVYTWETIAAKSIELYNHVLADSS